MKNVRTAIEIKNLYFSYDDAPTLSNVNLTILPFDSICIVGPNGGGKTTLMKLVIGLLSPDSGAVRIFGHKPEDAFKLISYVPQHAYYDTHFPISVIEVVCMGRLGNSFTGRYSSRDKEIAHNALVEVDLGDLAKRPFSALSGGQRQRVLIARALASEGEILILDEPTANIDKESESHLFEILTKLNSRMTILMVTHDVGFASTFFKRIACVNRDVVIHPTNELTGDIIKDMYGGDFSLIRHDHVCSTEGHRHD